ncbi:hypothetical protein QAD02_010945 [Eretmocerus hayati]|uniref:Uncharacterized protein n=1 Tax=Eretmocerus hayati TaxID=131215 RepID=A0ACC2NV70_9HYME|nr:hypothetical protein QAD02_010945 [Eretmocerus hayati]
MGASQSSRKLTITNDEDDANVIRISDAVAQRLAQSASSAPVDPPPRPIPQMSTGQAPITTQNVSDCPPSFTISALAVQQQKEKELADQEVYWKRRLQNLEKTHEKINKAIDDEYKKALTIFDDCRVIKAQNAVKPCSENSKKVLKCYQENPRETLRCADLVAQFSSCVDQRRANLMKCN